MVKKTQFLAPMEFNIKHFFQFHEMEMDWVDDRSKPVAAFF